MASNSAAMSSKVEIHTSSHQSALPFPEEVLEAILYHLSPLELVTLCQTSRSLRRIATSSILWERSYYAFWREGDAKKEVERGTAMWRQKRRYRALRSSADASWAARSNDRAFGGRTTQNMNGNGEKRMKREIQEEGESRRESLQETSKRRKPSFSHSPFPCFLSSCTAEFDMDDPLHFSDKGKQPSFYELFLERMETDRQVLNVIKEQCCSVGKWIRRAKTVVDLYGNDAKDVLHALVNAQMRKVDVQEEQGLGKDVFPTPLSLRLAGTKRSPTHHLSLLHFGRELLEHLQSREAMLGLVSIRPGNQKPHSNGTWAGCASTGEMVVDDVVEKGIRRAFEFERATNWITMFKGGEGREVSEELDVLAISCSLYLRGRGITLQEDARPFVSGICQFLDSRGFRGASQHEYNNLDNNFLHRCLDESGRKSLPLTLTIVFCSIAARLGLPALPTNTPARIVAVIEWPQNQAEHEHSNGQSVERFWVDMYEQGLLMSEKDLASMLVRMRLPPDESFMAPSTPIQTTLRASRNIVNSVQRAQVTPGHIFNAQLVNESLVSRSNSNHTRPPHPLHDASLSSDQVFEKLAYSPNYLFVPRRTYKISPSSGPNLCNPFWISDEEALQAVGHARYPRVNHWSEYEQQAAMHAAANALTRLGDELGERGSDWCASLVQSYFPLDVLLLEREFVGDLAPSERRQESEDISRSGERLLNLSAVDSQPGTPSTLDNDHGATEGEEAPSASMEEMRSPLYVEDGRIRGLLGHFFRNLRSRDAAGPLAKLRSKIKQGEQTEGQGSTNGTDEESMYPVGTIFVHRSYGYRAAIVSWDTYCDATDEWISSMGVDRLPQGGRSQPFYHSIVDDGSTRYVGHCNILPATLRLPWNERREENGQNSTSIDPSISPLVPTTGATSPSAPHPPPSSNPSPPSWPTSFSTSASPSQREGLAQTQASTVYITNVELETILALRGAGRLFRCVSVEGGGEREDKVDRRKLRGRVRLLRNKEGEHAFPHDG